MATQFPSHAVEQAQPAIRGSLGDPSLAILGPRRDALLFWGAPIAALLLVQAWLWGWSALAPEGVAGLAALSMVGFVSVLTWAHLIAVAPRAYLNREVFAAYRLRLTLVPVLLLAALAISPAVLVIAGVVAIFWDVHHSAMQNFGFARIYDMKAGNSATQLRATDLRLNWMLYVGPLAAGASMLAHADKLHDLAGTPLMWLATAPGVLAADSHAIRLGAIGLYAAVLVWTVIDYRRAIRAGYRLPAHKLATMVVTGAVSLLAWGFSPPLVALAAINLYHAVQYFALVWVKEGGRMTARTGSRRAPAMLIFLVGTGLFGLAYAAVAAGEPTMLLAPFVACSLLHFWYDSFVWSVRRKQV